MLTANNLICGLKAAVFAVEITLGALISSVGGQLTFLDLLAALLRTLDVNILTVPRLLPSECQAAPTFQSTDIHDLSLCIGHGELVSCVGSFYLAVQ